MINILILLISIIIFSSCEDKAGYHDLKPISKNKNLHAVIEIPAGTAKMYQYDRASNGFKLERKNGKDKKFLGLSMPFNFGFLPSTKTKFTVDKNNPELDVVVIGEKISTSSLVDIKIIGSIQFAHKDSSRRDLSENVIYNVIVAVPIDKELATINVDSYRELTKTYRGQRKIIEIYLEDVLTESNMTFYAWKDEKFAKDLFKTTTLTK
ncbi:MAG: inorganic diphosphatase [Candidatus Kapaibacteriota bacterium]|jgi:inorganic pyrophosphatase